MTQRLYRRLQSLTSSKKELAKWEDWKPTFLNYLRSIPGRDGIPLKYVCREKVASAPLTGNAYSIDAVQVHTFLLNFVTGNDTAEAKIQGLSRPNDGCKAFKLLVDITRWFLVTF